MLLIHGPPVFRILGRAACLKQCEANATVHELCCWYSAKSGCYMKQGASLTRNYDDSGHSAICTAAAHWKTLWSKTGQQQRLQNDPWRRAAAVLPAGTRNIRFVGVAGHSYQSDMAIDSIDLSVSLAPTGSPTTPTSRPSNALGDKYGGSVNTTHGSSNKVHALCEIRVLFVFKTPEL